MSVKIRDEFSPSTKKLLAGRVGHRCSNPGCRKPTIGPASDITKVVILGDAAHITAASPGGPRYDPELSTEERRHYNNGIWCCPGCAELIDKDATGYPVEVLRHWKTEAEGAAKENWRGHISPQTCSMDLTCWTIILLCLRWRKNFGSVKRAFISGL